MEVITVFLPHLDVSNPFSNVPRFYTKNPYLFDHFSNQFSQHGQFVITLHIEILQLKQFLHDLYLLTPQIPLVADLPVGRDYQDHCSVPMDMFLDKIPVPQSDWFCKENMLRLKHIINYLIFGKGEIW